MTPSNTTSEGRYQPPEVRRRQILDAAARLATSEGLERTSIARVAEEAGLAKGSIYLQFESRHDLISALQSEVWAEMMEVPRSLASDESLAWAERLDAVVAHWMRFEADHHRLYHAVFHAVVADDGEPWNEARALLRDLVTGGATEGAFDLATLDVDVVVEFLLHAYTGPCYHLTDIERAIVNVQQLFRRVVGATRG